MARSSRHRCLKKSSFSAIKVFAIFLLADAEEQDEELIAIAVASMACEQRCAHRFNKHYGRRGPYNQRKSEDFFRIILNVASDRTFKAWFRYETQHKL
jgi:hypothetical protein